MLQNIKQLKEIFVIKAEIFRVLKGYTKPIDKIAEDIKKDPAQIYSDEDQQLIQRILENHFFGQSGILKQIDALITLNHQLLALPKPSHEEQLVVKYYNSMIALVEKEQKYLVVMFRRTLIDIREGKNYHDYWKESLQDYEKFLVLVWGSLKYFRLLLETQAKAAVHWLINLIYGGKIAEVLDFIQSGTAEILSKQERDFFKRLLESLNERYSGKVKEILEEGKNILEDDEFGLLQLVINKAIDAMQLIQQGIEKIKDMARALAAEINELKKLKVSRKKEMQRNEIRAIDGKSRQLESLILITKRDIPEIGDIAEVEKLKIWRIIKKSRRKRDYQEIINQTLKVLPRMAELIQESVELRRRIEAAIEQRAEEYTKRMRERRAFLKKAAIGTAALAVGGAAIETAGRIAEKLEQTKKPESWQYSLKPELKFADVTIPEVAKTIKTEGSYRNSWYVVVIPHTTELNALVAAKAAAQGPITWVDESGDRTRKRGDDLELRNLWIKTSNGIFQVDPNNAFCYPGICRSIDRIYSEGLNPTHSDSMAVNTRNYIIEAVNKFTEEVSRRIFKGRMILALHQNTQNNFGIRSYKDDLTYSKYAAEVFINPSEDNDDFAYVNTRGWFEALKSLGWNVVLQKNDRAVDNGSISHAATWINLPYVNIEVEIGKHDKQEQMIRQLNELIEQYPQLASDMGFVPVLRASSNAPPTLESAYRDLRTRYGVKDDEKTIIVFGDRQRIYLVSGDSNGITIHKEYPVSTGKNGFGNVAGSGKTPSGVLKIKQKVGDNAKIGTIFKSRISAGKAYMDLDQSVGALMTSRLLVLHGQEEENRNTGITRPIYIHGTNKENKIGTPDSGGCIRMRNTDIIELFNLVPQGTYVYVVPEAPAKQNQKFVRNILLIGSDMSLGRGRGDSLELISTDADKKVIRILTIPRDTYVNVRGKGRTKINHALAYGGWQLQKIAIEDFLGINVDKVFYLNRDNLRNILQQINQSNINTNVIRDVLGKVGYMGSAKAGLEEAISFISNRAMPEAAVGRAKNHARVLAACIKTSREYYSDPTKRSLFEEPFISELLKFVIYTDLTPQEVNSLIAEWFNGNYRIELYCIPGVPNSINGVSYWIPENISGFGRYFTKVINYDKSRFA